MAKSKPRIIKVPDITHPTKCFKQQPGGMARCGFKKRHKGRHAWDKS